MAMERYRNSYQGRVAVNLYCAQCESQIGIFDNEWVRLTTSYARSQEKGTHFGTEIGNRTQVVPSGPAHRTAEGCVMAEVFCCKCSNMVGQYCKTAPDVEKQALVDQYFYKLSRTFLKDSQTNSKVDPVFGYGSDIPKPSSSQASMRLGPAGEPNTPWANTPLRQSSRTPVISKTQDKLQRESRDTTMIPTGRKDEPWERTMAQLRKLQEEVRLQRLTSKEQAIQLSTQVQRTDEQEQRAIKQETTLEELDSYVSTQALRIVEQEEVIQNQAVQIQQQTLQLTAITTQLNQLQTSMTELRKQLTDSKSTTASPAARRSDNYVSSEQIGAMIDALRATQDHSKEMKELHEENRSMRSRLSMITNAMGAVASENLVDGIGVELQPSPTAADTLQILGKRKRDLAGQPASSGLGSFTETTQALSLGLTEQMPTPRSSEGQSSPDQPATNPPGVSVKGKRKDRPLTLNGEMKTRLHQSDEHTTVKRSMADNTEDNAAQPDPTIGALQPHSTPHEILEAGRNLHSLRGAGHKSNPGNISVEAEHHLTDLEVGRSAVELVRDKSVVSSQRHRNGLPVQPEESDDLFTKPGNEVDNDSYSVAEKSDNSVIAPPDEIMLDHDLTTNHSMRNNDVVDTLGDPHVFNTIRTSGNETHPVKRNQGGQDDNDGNGEQSSMLAGAHSDTDTSDQADKSPVTVHSKTKVATANTARTKRARMSTNPYLGGRRFTDDRDSILFGLDRPVREELMLIGIPEWIGKDRRCKEYRIAVTAARARWRERHQRHHLQSLGLDHSFTSPGLALTTPSSPHQTRLSEKQPLCDVHNAPAMIGSEPSQVDQNDENSHLDEEGQKKQPQTIPQIHPSRESIGTRRSKRKSASVINYADDRELEADDTLTNSEVLVSGTVTISDDHAMVQETAPITRSRGGRKTLSGAHLPARTVLAEEISDRVSSQPSSVPNSLRKSWAKDNVGEETGPHMISSSRSPAPSREEVILERDRLVKELMERENVFGLQHLEGVV